MNSNSEQEMVSGILNGDKNELARYLTLRRQDLLAVILSKMGPALRTKVEAEDILQEVSQKAVESFQDVQFTEPGPFGWICEVADRVIIDVQRKFAAKKRDVSKEVGIHGSGNDSDIGLINLLVASITSPSKAFSRKQKEFKLMSALNNLNDDQKTALELRYGQGKSSKQIAAEIGKSDGATRVLISRSLSQLRSLVEQLDTQTS